MDWIKEIGGRWDDNKARIIGGAAAGIFDDRYAQTAPGDLVPGMWWRVERDGAVVGYGWMDVVWGDAEILMATSPDAEGSGVGSFILENLGREAAGKGLNYIYNTVRATHPNADAVARWLRRRGFEDQQDGRLTRRAVT